MPKKSNEVKVADFILTSDGFYGIITHMDSERATVRYFDDGFDNGIEYADFQQQFHINDIGEMREDFLKESRASNVKRKR